MAHFLIRRIFWALFLFFVATIITYLIFWVIPTNPAQLAAGHAASPEFLASSRSFVRRVLRIARVATTLRARSEGEPK